MGRAVAHGCSSFLRLCLLLGSLGFGLEYMAVATTTHLAHEFWLILLEEHMVVGNAVLGDTLVRQALEAPES